MSGITFAGIALLIIFGLLILFHILILFGVIPQNIVWAGKIKNQSELVKMEIISLMVLGIFTIWVALKVGYLSFFRSETVISTGMWILLGYFVLNLLGNFKATSPIEKYGFGSLTFMIILLILFIQLAS